MGLTSRDNGTVEALHKALPRALYEIATIGGSLVTSMTMVQIFINIFLAVGLGFLFIRMFRPQKDDPRLSRGLQLLQSKISILEDLSDRTDHQFKQMGLLLDEKAKEVQSHITSAQEQIYRLGESMKKSQDVARIFQDKIPHEEIIERQNTVKYVRAAQMANQGYTVAEIQKAVDIPASELEFIVKVNRDRLMFSVDQLPDWIKNELQATSAPTPIVEKAYREAFEPLPDSTQTLAKIGEEFRKAVQDMNFVEKETLPPVPTIDMTTPQSSNSDITNTQVVMADSLAEPQSESAMPTVAKAPTITTHATGKRGIISAEVGQSLRKYQFPKVTTDNPNRY